MKDFQSIFGLTPDGVVGKATWYAVRRIYNAVKRLNEIDSEGVSLSEVTDQFESELSLGAEGNAVANLQLFINCLVLHVYAPRDRIPYVNGRGKKQCLLSSILTEHGFAFKPGSG